MRRRCVRVCVSTDYGDEACVTGNRRDVARGRGTRRGRATDTVYPVLQAPQSARSAGHRLTAQIV
eukprot:724834-Prymnesium_polylepis.1